MRIGLIGCGEIARRGHLSALRSLKDFQVVALADQDKDRVKKVANEFGIARTYTSAPELIEDKVVEAIVATTPPLAYKEIVSSAAHAGKPVLVEKPVALNTSDALFIRNKVEESGIKFGVVQNYRYFPALQDIKSRLSKHRIGNPLSIHILLHIHSPLSWSLSPWKFSGPDGAVGDIGPHAFDAMLWLAGTEPKRLFAYGGPILPGARFINQACILLEFPGDVVGFVDLSFLTGQMAFKVSVLGTGGRIFSDILFNQVDEQHGRSLPTKDMKLIMDKFKYILKGIGSGELFIGPLKYYQYLYPDFSRYVAGTNPGFPNIDTGMQTVKVIEAVVRCITTGKESYL